MIISKYFINYNRIIGVSVPTAQETPTASPSPNIVDAARVTKKSMTNKLLNFGAESSTL